MEAAVRYISMVQSDIVRISEGPSVSIFPICNMLDDLNPKPTTKGWQPSEVLEMFKAADEAYQILMSNDKNSDFAKDWSHLERRWKVEQWIWHRLFIIDRSIQEKNVDHAIIILPNVIKVRAIKECPDLVF